MPLGKKPPPAVPTPDGQGAWAPLAQPVFRALWIAALVSNIGTWMQDVGAAWLMTSLSGSPLLVALVQAATALPVMLLALPAGALADIVDRRRLLLFTQTWMLLAAAGLGALAISGRATAPLLLAFTLALGMGSAFSLPAWSATVPEWVGRQQLQAAIALNGLSMNVSRAVGPALAGHIIALASPGAVFLLNAVSFVGIIVVLARWDNPPKVGELPAERLAGAVRNGLRYARHSQPLKAVMARAGAFFFFASAAWALLPLLVRRQLHGGPGDYGMVLGAIGLGAVVAVFALPWLRQRMGTDLLQKAAATAYALTMALMSQAPTLPWLQAAALVSGMAWLSVMACIQGVAQTTLPAWVRARGLSMVMVVVMAGMAGGAMAWGQAASWLSVPEALQTASAGLALGVIATWRIRLAQAEGVDLTPSMHWPAPTVDQEPAFDRGPVLVTLAYRVAPARLPEFLRLMDRQRIARQRDGAFFWQLFQDAAASDCYLETFMAESWLEHLRHHQRVTESDRQLQDEIRRCLAESCQPVVAHYVAAEKPQAVNADNCGEAVHFG